MLWGDACSQVAALAAKFVEGTRVERWEAVRDHLGFESGDGKNCEPLEFLFAIGASSQPPRNDPECKLLIRFKRQKGDASSVQI